MTAAELRAQLRAGHWREARETAVAALAHDADSNGEIEAVLARVLVRLGLPLEAREAALSAARRGAGWRIELALGEAALAVGEPGEARSRLAALRQPVHDDPEASHEVGLALASVLRSVGEAARGYALAQVVLGPAEDADDDIAQEETLIVLGQTAYGCDLLPEAEGAFERALESRRERDAAPVLVAEALDGIGQCLRRQGRPFDAVERHRAALDLWIDGAGDDSGPVSACRHSLAQALHHTGDFNAARDEMARALLSTARNLGRDHVDTWITRFELARYDVDCGEMDDGFVRMSDARDEVCERLGAQHPVVRAMDRWL